MPGAWNLWRLREERDAAVPVTSLRPNTVPAHLEAFFGGVRKGYSGERNVNELYTHPYTFAFMFMDILKPESSQFFFLCSNPVMYIFNTDVVGSHEGEHVQCRNTKD